MKLQFSLQVWRILSALNYKQIVKDKRGCLKLFCDNKNCVKNNQKKHNILLYGYILSHIAKKKTGLKSKYNHTGILNDVEMQTDSTESKVSHYALAITYLISNNFFL